MTDEQADLVTKMRRLARGNHRGRRQELLDAADNLERAIADAEAHPARLVGWWARARRIYTEVRGVGLME